MEEMYLEDLENSTEIVLSDRRKVRPISHPDRPRQPRTSRRSGKGSAGRAAAGAISVGSAVRAAITNRRVLGPAEARIMAGAGGALLLLSLAAMKWPRGFIYPLALFAAWSALALFIRSYRLHRRGVREWHEKQAKKGRDAEALKGGEPALRAETTTARAREGS
jgi:cardiolipin synthase